MEVAFLDSDGHPLAWVVGGEEVMRPGRSVIASGISKSPIVGFHIKDALGRVLFGDNTSLNIRRPSLAELSRSRRVVARFHFRMPILPRGDYSVNVAIANGTQEDHVQQHWIHDALTFRSESSSVCTGLVGIPMHSIELETLEQADHSTADDRLNEYASLKMKPW